MGAAYASPPPPAGRTRRVWPWVIVLVVGVLLMPLGVGLFAGSKISALFSADPRQTPFSVQQRLGPGTYYVFEDRADVNGGSSGFPSSGLQLSVGDVTVTSSDGSRVAVFAYSGGETRIISTSVFVPAVGFTVASSATYTIRVASPSGNPVPAFVAPSFQTLLSGGTSWLSLTLLGVLLAILGLVMTILRATQRSRRRRAELAVVGYATAGAPGFAPFAPQTATAAAPPVASRCANGHDASSDDKFCRYCGAPVYPAAQAGRT